MTRIDSGRSVRSYTQRIEAPPERVFPLLCPVREAEWLEGWSDAVEMLHSHSGVAEDGCVFRTRVAGGPETVWMITRHDSAERVVEFFRVTTGLAATRLRINVEGDGNGSSAVFITYTFTPLSPAGRAFVEQNHSEQVFQADMAFWEASMCAALAGRGVPVRPHPGSGARQRAAASGDSERAAAAGAGPRAGDDHAFPGALAGAPDSGAARVASADATADRDHHGASRGQVPDGPAPRLTGSRRHDRAL